jgi:hypothetical protein
MPKIQIVILIWIAAILFIAYLLIGLLSKMSESSKAEHFKNMDDSEQGKSFKL